jgi:hypothetical protein
MPEREEISFSADEERSFAAIYNRAAASRATLAETTPSQLMFYNPENYPFAFAWASISGTNRWIFPVETTGPRFIYYICKRQQDLGQPAMQLLMASKGAGALFYAAPDSYPENSDVVVGQLPLNTTPADFASTTSRFMNPGPTYTLLSDSTAGNQTFEGNEYMGSDLMVMMAAVAPGVVRASDAEVTCNADGTAVTAGNIWRCDPTGDPFIESPAPGSGATQPFPLAPVPINA